MPSESTTSTISITTLWATTLLVTAAASVFLVKNKFSRKGTIGSCRVPLKVAVVGAGSIGSVAGLALARRPYHDVLLVGRQSLLNSVMHHQGHVVLHDKSRQGKPESFVAAVLPGTEQTSYDGEDESLPSVGVTDQLVQVKDYPIIIVSTKTTSTKEVAKGLAQVLPTNSTATILSFQNGVRNAAILREALQNHKSVKIVSGMVNFNAVWVNNSNVFVKTTDGGVKLELPSDGLHKSRVESLAKALEEEHVPCPLTDDIQPILYSKLILINIFNPINALAGKSTLETLCYKGYRQVWSAAIAEGLTICEKSNIPVARFRGVPPILFTYLGAIPESVLWFVLGRIVHFDGAARSSMLQDWERGRIQTEIDDLAGEIVRLAENVGAQAPINSALLRLVKKAETDAKGSPGFSPEQLVQQVTS